MSSEDLWYRHERSREIYLELESCGIIKNITSNCLGIFGYEREFMIGKSINNFTSKDIDINLFHSHSQSDELCITFKKVDGETVHMDTEYEVQDNGDDLPQINLYLVNISKYLKEEQKLKSLLKTFEQSNDIIYALNIKPKFEYVYLSPAIERVLGYSLEENYKNPYLACERVHKDYLDIHMKKLTGDMDYSKQVVTRYKHKISGEYIWYEDYVIPTYNELGEVVRIDGICREINERKILEEKLIDLSYHDSLTGLYNRTYFEKITKSLNDETDHRTSIIIGDLDNLKRINDKLGHEQGDQLIKDIAKIIKYSFEKHSAFRLGGDEFAIIINDLEYEQVQKEINRFKKEINIYNNTKPKLPLKISIGFSYAEHSLGQVNKLFKVADKNMYEDKLNNKINLSQTSPL